MPRFDTIDSVLKARDADAMGKVYTTLRNPRSIVPSFPRTLARAAVARSTYYTLATPKLFIRESNSPKLGGIRTQCYFNLVLASKNSVEFFQFSFSLPTVRIGHAKHYCSTMQWLGRQGFYFTSSVYRHSLQILFLLGVSVYRSPHSVTDTFVLSAAPPSLPPSYSSVSHILYLAE